MRHLPLLLALPLASGCFFSSRQENRPLDPPLIAQLVPGETTAPQAVAALGAPTEVVQLGLRSAYRYDHTHAKDAGLWLGIFFLRGADVQSDRVWLFFDEEDVLSHVGASFEAASASFSVPPLSPRD